MRLSRNRKYQGDIQANKKTACLVLTVFSTLLWAGRKDTAQPTQTAAPQAPVLSGKKVIVADANSTHHLNLYVAYGLVPAWYAAWVLPEARPVKNPFLEAMPR